MSVTSASVINSSAAIRQQLDRAAAQRFADRQGAREAKAQAIQQAGVLAAAGLGAAVRRALQLSVQEGRATLTDPLAHSASLLALSAAPASATGTDRQLEAIVGFNDTDQINFLNHGLRAAQPVCRLVCQDQPIGTGFLVAPGLLLTNHHVLPDANTAAQFIAQFNYALDGDDNPLQPCRYALDATTFLTSDVDAYDFTLVGVRSSANDTAPLTQFGWLPLNPSPDKILEGEPVIIIQHPQGREKQICLFHSELLDRQNQYVYYSTDTEVGSSGSPAFNRQWQVIALHHASAPSGQLHQGKGTAANEGIRISAIISSLQANDRIAGDPAKLLNMLLDPRVQRSGRPAAPLPFAPNIVTAPPSLGTVEGGTVIQSRPPTWYSHPPRAGFDPKFLGTAIPLPKLPAALARDVTKIAGGTTELKYTHYSVVMCASRKLAYFSAANLDGATAKSLKRTDRDPAHPQALSPTAPPSEDALEAADVWWYDGRIPAAAQLGPEVYDGTVFDFGHLTRRLDPVWGDDATARIANDDTFVMTNCSPQHEKLNRVTWAALEDAVYAAATAHKLRFVVITGPVLDPRDPTIKGVQIPLAFWKVIAYPEAGQLRAMGFLQWQRELIPQGGARDESLTELGKAEAWHVPLTDIVRLTALDFGPLLAADVKTSTPAHEPLTEGLIATLIPAVAVV